MEVLYGKHVWDGNQGTSAFLVLDAFDVGNFFFYRMAMKWMEHLEDYGFEGIPRLERMRAEESGGGGEGEGKRKRKRKGNQRRSGGEGMAVPLELCTTRLFVTCFLHSSFFTLRWYVSRGVLRACV